MWAGRVGPGHRASSSIPLDELGRPRVDVTLRISGFFRDAFPHLSPSSTTPSAWPAFDEPAEPVRPPARSSGAKPGAYGSGILPLLESRDWRTDDDLAAVYLAWGGFAYGRRGWACRRADAMRRRFAAIEVAVKNQDNREHDIFDSDDYLQDHGGMVATIRALTGRRPEAWFGDSRRPGPAPGPQPGRGGGPGGADPGRSTRSGSTAMQRHGYKGAFEMAATVDYLFGYDATAHVVEDWMYERVTDAYVADPDDAEVLRGVQPVGAARRSPSGCSRRPSGACGTPATRRWQTLRAAVLEAEGWEEGR